MSYGLVTIFTQVYNTKNFVKQCIESVLQQTYPNFEYIVVDNGCTDGSSEILCHYAKMDSRIRLVQFKNNCKFFSHILINKMAKSEYITVIDSDDWWETDYLERLLLQANKEDLDMVCTGTQMHVQNSAYTSFRKVDSCLLLSNKEYANALPLYHVFFRTIWAKLIRVELFRNTDFTSINALHLPYGTDTLLVFAMLKKSTRIGIDNSVLHHYRIHKKSISYQYAPGRFEADIYLYHDAIDFLSAYGPVSEENKRFLSIIYANALTDTIGVINDANLSPQEKLSEFRKIVAHPITQGTYRRHDQSIQRSKHNLLISALNCGVKLQEDSEDFRTVVQSLAPQCGPAISSQTVPLLAQNQSLIESLQSDNREVFLRQLLTLIHKKKHTKEFDLGSMVRTLSLDKLPLCTVDDIDFLRTYQDLYLTIWQGKYAQALDAMTGLLLEGQATVALETFLSVYISLAALCEQVPAFLLGKEQLALLLFQEKRVEECRGLLSELEEIGVEDTETLLKLRTALEGIR